MTELSSLERIVLTTLLRIGPLTPLEVAVQSLLHPDDVLDALFSLMDKGYVYRRKRAKGIERHVYFPNDKGIAMASESEYELDGR
jgi:DNA-binding MarR family transcriptional regulator